MTISASRLTGSALSGATAVTLEGSQSAVAALMLEAYGLTARERELAALALEGLSNREIAERLFLSPYTVGDRRKAILEKSGAHSKRELIAGRIPPFFAKRPAIQTAGNHRHAPALHTG